MNFYWFVFVDEAPISIVVEGTTVESTDVDAYIDPVTGRRSLDPGFSNTFVVPGSDLQKPHDRGDVVEIVSESKSGKSNDEGNSGAVIRQNASGSSRPENRKQRPISDGHHLHRNWESFDVCL